jgi:predicted ATPase/DNA-binding CsgD family transcriptional regulator
MPGALACHHAILNEKITAHGGYVFQIIGAAFCAAFSTVRDGLDAALAAQRALRDTDWGALDPIRVRMALHTGTAEVRVGEHTSGEYVSGLTLSRAARLLSAGHGGQILLSLPSVELVRNQLPSDVSLCDLDVHRLKDSICPEHIYQAVVPDLRSEFPPIKTLDTQPNNLPSQLTSFIGREQEIERIKELLAGTRLLTLTGAGGSGKTRLALRVASDLQDGFADGIRWVDLAPLADPSLLPQAIAKAMTTGEPTGRSLQDLILDLLRDQHLLLVLDNCEHLANACAEFVQDALCDAPHLHILATSRQPLAVIGEMLYPVPPLALPPASQVTEIMSFDSIRLFVERAQGILPGFILTPVNALPVAEICRRLDGIPLAIELASARVNTLTVEQIAARLDNCFALLTSTWHGVPSHHRTLRAAIDWSYSTLTTQEQVLLRRLSVFARGCTLEAVERVCAGEGISAEEIVDLLTSLVNKSLVVAETLKRGAARYRMLETIRQYAHDRLHEQGEGEAIRNRHLDYFLAFAEDVEPKLHGPDQDEWLDRLDRDHDNLRAALDWSLGEGRVEKGLRLAAALTWFWEMRTYWTEARQRTKALLSQPEAAPRTLARAKALLAVATMGGWGGINKQERPCVEELIAIARKHGAAGKRLLAYGLAELSHMIFYADLPGALSIIDEGLDIASSLHDEWLVAYLIMLRGWFSINANNLPMILEAMEESLRRFNSVGDRRMAMNVSALISFVYFKQGDLARARQDFENLLPIARQWRERRYLVFLLSWLGDIEWASGRYSLAKKYCTESLEIAREFGDKMLIAWDILDLGIVSLDEHNLDRARSLMAETLVLSRASELKNIVDVDWAIFGFACLAAVEKNARRAIQLLAFTDKLFKDINPAHIYAIERKRYLSLVREQVDQETFAAAWAEGCALSLEQAISIAEQELLAPPLPSPAPMPPDPNALTSRETEVLRLVAAGLSDAQVAAQLVISRRTVSTHLTAIYGKLGVGSRGAATRYALDHHLI